MIENFNEIKNFLTGEENETISLIKQITVIPAPSTKEFKRAEFIKNKLISYGAKGVYIDDVFNVIYPVNVKNSTNVTAFFAHTDTVFSDETTMPMFDDGEYIYSPGVTDNVVCVAQMLTVCKYIATRGVEDNGNGLLFVFNSCEEGLGNLKGAKKIFEDFGSVIKRAYSFDGQYDALVCEAVGSHRYKVTVKTEGGHSFNAFGNKSAIAISANIINMLYNVTPPVVKNSKTTYNVGVIKGGTSVNAIAEETEFYYEYRSDNSFCLNAMRGEFLRVINTVKMQTGVDITIETVGERPCSGRVDQEEMQRLINSAVEITEKYSGEKCLLFSGSTDCNIPLSLGIPALCVGTHKGYGAHTREEKLLKSSVVKGLFIVAEIVFKCL